MDGSIKDSVQGRSSGWAYDGNKKYVPHAWVEVAINVDNVFYWVPIDPDGIYMNN